MAQDDHQEFDEFDSLVDNNDTFAAVGEEAPPARKKTSFGIIIGLLVIVGLAGAGAWYFLLRPSQSLEPTFTPTAAPATATNDGTLPPGVVAPVTDATPPVNDTAAMAPAIDGQQQPMATTPTDPTAMPTDPSALPTPQAAAPATTDGVVAEAMPAPTGLQDPTLPDGSATPVTADSDAVEKPLDLGAPEGSPVASGDVTASAVTDPVTTGDTGGTSAVTADTPAAMPAPTASAAMPAADQATTAAPAAADPAAPVDTARLERLEQQLQTLANDFAASQDTVNATSTGAMANDTVLADQLKTLADKVDAMTQQVTALDQRTTELATALQNRDNSPSAAAPMVAIDAPQVAQEAPAKPKPVIRKPAPKPAPRRPAAVSANGWELRSATPGAAWLGKAGSGEMARYAVGQTVPGLGTIQAVTQENGRWVVKTTGGTIRE